MLTGCVAFNVKLLKILHILFAKFQSRSCKGLLQKLGRWWLVLAVLKENSQKKDEEILDVAEKQAAADEISCNASHW